MLINVFTTLIGTMIKKIKDIREYSIEKIIDPITLELRVSIEDFRRWLGVDEKKIWLHTGGK
jgi:hypothetical protein